MLCRPACGDPKPGNWDLTGGVELTRGLTWRMIDLTTYYYLMLRVLVSIK